MNELNVQILVNAHQEEVDQGLTVVKEGEEEVTVESETMILKLQNLKIEIKEVDDEEVVQEKRITKSKLGTF